MKHSIKKAYGVDLDSADLELDENDSEGLRLFRATLEELKQIQKIEFLAGLFFESRFQTQHNVPYS